MDSFRYFFLICCTFGVCYGCELLTARLVRTGSMYFDSSGDCYGVEVPDGYHIHIFAVQDNNCHLKFEIKVAGSDDETQNLCSGNGFLEPVSRLSVKADSYVTIRLQKAWWINHGVSVTLNYEFENIICKNKDAFVCSPGNCIAHTKVCDGSKDCLLGEDEHECESTICKHKDAFVCSPGNCIAHTKVCDGSKDCLHGEDEKECENSVFAVVGLEQQRNNSLEWLKKASSYSDGWKENTHRALVALYLATEMNLKHPTVVEELWSKQLETQTLVALLRNDSEPVSTNQLSMFINAMLVTCQDPRHFHGYDLVQMLKSQTQFSSLTSHPVSYLALCNAQESLPENVKRDLTQVLRSTLEHPFLIDLQAVAVMSVSCLIDSGANISNTSDLNQAYEESIEKFKLQQLPDGSFGNVYTTAIVTQALLSADHVNSKGWSFSKAVGFLVTQLKSRSVDFLTTYLALPILNRKSLTDVRTTNCSFRSSSTREATLLENLKDHLGPKMRVQFSLYIGEDKEFVHTMSLRVPENATVFEIMQLAQEQDPKYRFEWKKIGQKSYIYRIDGITNDVEDGQFWLLYSGKNADSLKATSETPDKVTIQDGELVVMWYRRTVIH